MLSGSKVECLPAGGAGLPGMGDVSKLILEGRGEVRRGAEGSTATYNL